MLQNLGLLGLFIGCALSATIVPFSSEPLLAGALLLDYNKWIVVLVATIGNTLGGMVSFLLGWLCKWEWIEKYLKIEQATLEKTHAKISRYGLCAGLFTWLPFVGDVIAISMGLIRLNPWMTCMLMFIGKLARYILVAGIINLF